MELKNKSVFISGAASGIGRSLAYELATKNQALVHAVDLNLSALENLKHEAKKYSGHIQIAKLDINDMKQIEKSIQTIKNEHGKIDVWINNAGIVEVKNFDELSTDSIEKMIQTNFTSLCLITHSVLRQMEEQGSGTIVNIASISGFVPSPYIATYAACKHGVVGLTESLQEELRQKDSLIKLLLVAPGFIRTPLIEKDFPEWLKWTLANSDSVAKNIISAIEKNKSFIIPDLNGKMMNIGSKIMRRRLIKSSRILKAKSIKELFIK